MLNLKRPTVNNQSVKRRTQPTKRRQSLTDSKWTVYLEGAVDSKWTADSEGTAN